MIQRTTLKLEKDTPLRSEEDFAIRGRTPALAIHLKGSQTMGRHHIGGVEVTITQSTHSSVRRAEVVSNIYHQTARRVIDYFIELGYNAEEFSVVK